MDFQGSGPEDDEPQDEVEMRPSSSTSEDSFTEDVPRGHKRKSGDLDFDQVRITTTPSF